MTRAKAKAVAAMRKKAWSPAARAKRAATYAAKRAAKADTPGHVQDALAFLLKAETAIISQCAAGRKRISAAESLALLALNALRGEL